MEGYTDHFVKEMTEIRLHPDTFNTDMGFTQIYYSSQPPKYTRQAGPMRNNGNGL
jgi:hypothetical protein